jgi:hypothetical protein
VPSLNTGALDGHSEALIDELGTFYNRETSFGISHSQLKNKLT